MAALLGRLTKALWELGALPEDALQMSATRRRYLGTLQMVARLMPLLYEEVSDPGIGHLLWTHLPRPPFEAAAEAAAHAPPPTARKLYTVGGCLLHGLYRALFARGFTTAPTAALGDDEAAAAARNPWGASSDALDEARVVTMRAMVATLSATLYVPPTGLRSTPNRMLLAAAAAPEPHGGPLLKALLSVIFTYDPVGWGYARRRLERWSPADNPPPLLSCAYQPAAQALCRDGLWWAFVVGSLPFAASLLSDSQRDVAVMALQLLLALLSQPFVADDVADQRESAAAAAAVAAAAAADGATDDGGSGRHVGGAPLSPWDGTPLDRMSSLFASLQRPDTLAFLHHGFTRLLSSRLTAERAYLPTSASAFDCDAELLVLLWVALSLNRALVEATVKSDDLTSLVTSLAHLTLMWIHDVAHASSVNRSSSLPRSARSPVPSLSHPPPPSLTRPLPLSPARSLSHPSPLASGPPRPAHPPTPLRRAPLRRHRESAVPKRAPVARRGARGVARCHG